MRKYILLCLVFLTGCAPWLQVGGLYESGEHNFSVELPEGWMRLNTSEHLLITRDGVLLQNIIVEKIGNDKKLEHTKKKFAKGMLPQESAEVALDNISSNQDVVNLAVTENVPAKIGGYPGFKAVFTYKTKDGLKKKSVYYGFMLGEWFYGIRYTAAQRYYFDKDIATFEKVLASFKVTKGGK
ncbi:MAG: hypothetical protein AB1805_12835 [Nitrospirota bacterium]